MLSLLLLLLLLLDSTFVVVSTEETIVGVERRTQDAVMNAVDNFMMICSRDVKGCVYICIYLNRVQRVVVLGTDLQV